MSNKPVAKTTNVKQLITYATLLITICNYRANKDYISITPKKFANVIILKSMPVKSMFFYTLDKTARFAII